MELFLRSAEILLNIIEILIIIRIFLNILNVSLNNSIGRLIYEVTEPILIPSRALLNKLKFDRGFLDFSPWVAIIFLRIIYLVIFNVLG